MGFLNEGLESVRQAQDELLLRLDAMLVELRTMSELLHEVRSLLAETSTETGASKEAAVEPVPDIGA